MLKINQSYNLDCMDLLRQLDDDSVDCFILDPPYFMGYKPFINRSKKYKRMIHEWDNQWKNIEEYVEWCTKWIDLSVSKLAPGGSLLIFGSFHNAFDLWNPLKSNPELTFKNFVTWFLPNAMPIMMAKIMGVYAYSCQYIWYFTKGSKVRFFDYDHLKGLNEGKQQRDLIIHNNRPHSESVGHPTQKPYMLIEKLLRAHCPPHGLAVDFFGGSGTLGLAAKASNRNYILGEASLEYCEMIEGRLK